MRGTTVQSRTVRALVACLVVGAASMGGAPAGADEVRDSQWHVSQLDLARAHELSQGEGITVAVIDTGVDGNHPDLAGNVLEGVDLATGGNGWDDPHGHGTAMAGLIAAHGHGTGNADGAVGVAPRARIIPIRIAEDDGTTSAGTDLSPAFDAAMDLGVDVISFSFDGDVTSMDNVERAIDAGIVVVAAAGNRPEDSRITDVAAVEGVVAAGAIGPDGAVANISVRGNDLTPLTLAAPGVDVVSTTPGGNYRGGSGTSPAAAVVSGAVALVWSRYPELSGADVVDHLASTARDAGAPGQDHEYGFGVLDVVAALETPRSQTTTTLEDISRQLPPGLEERMEDEAAAEAADAEASSESNQTGAVGLLLVGIAAVLLTVAIVVVVRNKRRPSPPG